MKRKIAYYFRALLTFISPKLNTKVAYFVKFKRALKLNKPTKLNDKILWLKFNTYRNNPLIKKCADKYAVREYIKDINCTEILNDLLFSYNSPDEIEWDKMPRKFAMKLNIGCGYNHIITDFENEDISELNNEIKTWFRKAPKSYLGYSEMQYKGVKPILLIEKYLGGPNGELPEDYKFYCINGKVELVMLCVGRDQNGHGAKYYYYDRDWVLKVGYDNNDPLVEKPKMFDKAIEYAEKLSSDFPFVRVDLYIFDDKIVFGELTFTPAAGMDIDHNKLVKGTNSSLDDYYGKMLNL